MVEEVLQYGSCITKAIASGISCPKGISSLPCTCLPPVDLLLPQCTVKVVATSEVPFSLVHVCVCVTPLSGRGGGDGRL